MPEADPNLADDFVTISKLWSRWYRVRLPGRLDPRLQDIANELAPLCQKYEVDAGPILAYIRDPSIETSPGQNSALGELENRISRLFWKRWTLDLPRVTSNRLGPGTHEAKAAFDAFTGFEERFQNLLQYGPANDPDGPDYDEGEEWHKRAMVLCKDAAMNLRAASDALDPPFWGLRSFELAEYDEFFDEVIGMFELTPEDYWLLFVARVLTNEEFSSARVFPLDKLGPGYGVRIEQRVMNHEGEEVIGWSEEYELLCSASALACRLFANWCAGEGIPSAAPILDEATFSVCWRGKTCSLGNTQQFRLMQELAQTPNKYLAFTTLAERIGGDADDSIAHVKSRLAKALQQAQMSELVDRMRTEPGYYGLFLP